MTVNERVFKYRYLVPATVHRMRVPAHLVEDCTSEAWIALLDSARRFRPSRGVGFPSFALWRIRGAVADFVNAEATYAMRMTWSDAAACLAQSAPDSFGIAQTTEVLGRLVARDREMLLGVYVEGLTQAEASRTGKTWGSRIVRRALRRAQEAAR